MFSGLPAGIQSRDWYTARVGVAQRDTEILIRLARVARLGYGRNMTKTEYLSTGQVAKHYGVDPATVWRWCQRGILPYKRTLGGHIRIPRDALKMYPLAA